jgi:thiamine-phosphate pyrophosphorylase
MRPLLCLVTNRHVARVPLVDAVAAAVEAGVDRVQLREKDLDGRELLELARSLGERVRALRPGVELIVNRRIDVALAAGWDGVHLGFDAVAVSEARALLPGRALISVATHDANELTSPSGQRLPDCAHLAPVWSPISKAATSPPLGVAALRLAASRDVPMLAQGGVTEARAGQCIEAGAAGVAVTGEILSATDPGRAARAIRAALDSAAERRGGR